MGSKPERITMGIKILKNLKVNSIRTLMLIHSKIESVSVSDVQRKFTKSHTPLIQI